MTIKINRLSCFDWKDKVKYDRLNHDKFVKEKGKHAISIIQKEGHFWN